MIPILWDGAVPAFRGQADGRLREVLGALRLSRFVRGVVLKPLDGRYGDDAWIRWTHRQPMRLWLEMEAGVFLTPPGRRAASAAGLRIHEIPARRFSGRAFLEMLFHELMHVHDEVRHGIRVDAVPPAARQSFNEVWNVWIDGRIGRWGLPALGRRARCDFFLETFRGSAGRKAAGETFDRLWNGDGLDQAALMSAVGELRGSAQPKLHGQSRNR